MKLGPEVLEALEEDVEVMDPRGQKVTLACQDPPDKLANR